MGKIKKVDELNYIELKNEYLKRTGETKVLTPSAMKAEVQKHRDANPEFDLSPRPKTAEVNGFKMQVLPSFKSTDEQKALAQSIKENKNKSIVLPNEIKEVLEEKPLTKNQIEMLKIKNKIIKTAVKKTAAKKATVKKSVVKKNAAKKVATKKAVTKKAAIVLDVEALKKKFKTTLAKEIKKKYMIVALHIAGATNKEIEAMIGTNHGWIWNEVNSYKQDKKSFTSIIA